MKINMIKMDQFWSQEYKLPSNVEKEFAWYRISTNLQPPAFQ